MPYSSLEEIDCLTRKFRESVIQPDGSHVLKDEHMEYMRTIHFDLPNLDYDVLCEIPRFLVRTTVFPRGCRYGNADQPHFLAWIAEVCDYPNWDFKHKDERFRHLFGLLISSHLADTSSLLPSLRRPSSQVFMRFHVFAACFAFPFLERCIRTKCDEYVRDDGRVIKGFRIHRYGKTDRPYVRGRYMSNISHELKLLDRYVASPELRGRLRRFMDELNEDSLLTLEDPYELVGHYRNKLLHGEEIWSTGWATATYLVCLLFLDEITRDEYNSKMSDLREHAKWKQRTGLPFLWYNYRIG